MAFKYIWQNATYRFLITFLGTFALLYYANLFFIGITSPGNIYIPFLDNHFNYITGLRDILLRCSAWVLNLFGYKTFIHIHWLRVAGHGGIILVYSCLGYAVMAFFTAFVVAWPKSLKSKLWFLPFGLILIQALNICRFVLLSLYWRGSILKGLIDHHDLFNIILYAVLLFVVWLWTREDVAVIKGESSK